MGRKTKYCRIAFRYCPAGSFHTYTEYGDKQLRSSATLDEVAVYLKELEEEGYDIGEDGNGGRDVHGNYKCIDVVNCTPEESKYRAKDVRPN